MGSRGKDGSRQPALQTNKLNCTSVLDDRNERTLYCLCSGGLGKIAQIPKKTAIVYAIIELIQLKNYLLET